MVLYTAEFMEPALLLLEMIRLSALDDQPLQTVEKKSVAARLMGRMYEQGYEKQITLLSRVFAFIQPKFKSRSWRGRLDHDLLGFNEMMRAVCRTNRSLMETLNLSLFLKRLVNLVPAKLSELADSLPRFEEPSTVLGIAVKVLLGDVSWAHLDPHFPACVSIRRDLQRGYSFWKCVLKMLSSLSTEIDALSEQERDSVQSLHREFTLADDLLRARHSHLSSL
eukprot:GCRY01007814.1.p1 GENE.GCRY01007814.1~~GCRY01007814.1.p1  ORF type:complete len:223 (-),score=72.95 GCRY01007814.1:413-1081(-)